jgi:hypothetical protein
VQARGRLVEVQLVGERDERAQMPVFKACEHATMVAGTLAGGKRPQSRRWATTNVRLNGNAVP